jgi:hypothetical protein
MKVEVEIEDLETIIFATAIIKTIESQLRSRKEDPFVQPHLDYTRAHDALVLAMNSARRATADTKIQWDGELSAKEIKFLQQFAACPVFEVDGEYRKKRDEVDSLAAKGCIRIGQLVSGAVWPGEPKADIRPVSGYAIMITKRGNEKLGQVLRVGNANSDVNHIK